MYVLYVKHSLCIVCQLIVVHVVEPFCGRILKLHACGTRLQMSDTNGNSAM